MAKGRLTPGHSAHDLAMWNSNHTETHQQQAVFEAGMDDSYDVKGDDRDGWMLSYLDILTLLLTFFVILFAVTRTPSQPNEATTDNASTYAAVENATPDETPELPAASEIAEPSSAIKETSALPSTQLVAELGPIFDHLNPLIDVEAGQVQFTLGDEVLFPSGDAHLSSDGKSLLSELAPLLHSPDYSIAVEGHTDNLPVRGNAFDSNWELSSHRATSVTRFLIANGVPPQHLRAVGYADTQPLASNDTAEGRRKNRRVAIRVEITPPPP